MIHGVDVLVVEHLAEVARGRHVAAAERLPNLGHPLRVHVANGHDAIAGERLEPRQHLPRPGAAADDAEVDHVVRRRLGVGGVEPRDCHAEGGRGGGGAEELSSGGFVVTGGLLDGVAVTGQLMGGGLAGPRRADKWQIVGLRLASPTRGEPRSHRQRVACGRRDRWRSRRSSPGSNVR